MPVDPNQSSKLPAAMERVQSPRQAGSLTSWVVLAFFGGGLGGCTLSTGVFHSFMDVDADGLNPGSDLLSATALMMLLCGLLAALLAWRWSFAKR